MKIWEDVNGQEHSLRMRLTFVCDELDRLYDLVAVELPGKMSHLEAQGMTSARPYWMRKDDPELPDQLELTHSTHSSYYKEHGTRREYIGVKPDKIAAALARIERHEEHRALKRQHREVTQKIEAIERMIRQLEYVARAKQGHLYA